MNQDRAHDMPINDVNHVWTENRTKVSPSGYTYRLEVYMGRCTCGQTFEGRSSTEVTRAWTLHRRMVGADA